MAESLRVLLVSEPGLDGVFRHVEGLAAHLLGCGHQVDFAFSSIRSSDGLWRLVRRIEASGGRTLDLEVANELGLRDVRAWIRLRGFVRRVQPDVIHAHSSKAGGLVRLLPEFPEGRMFYSPHAYFGLRPGKHWRGRFYNRIERFLGRRGTTLNVSGSEAGFADVVLGVPPRRRKLILNGVQTSRFAPPSPEQVLQARRHLKVPPDALVLGTVARLTFQKDPQTLYRAFAVARATGRSIHLLHLGTGPVPHFAQEMITAELRPYVTRVPVLDDTLPVYHAADAFIMTSRYEGMPLVVLEAMSCGLPLILTDVGGHDDILRLPLSAAHVFPAEDAVRGAAAICAWADRADREKANNHREMACTYFDCGGAYTKICDAYEEACGVRKVRLPERPAMTQHA